MNHKSDYICCLFNSFGFVLFPTFFFLYLASQIVDNFWIMTWPEVLRGIAEKCSYSQLCYRYFGFGFFSRWLKFHYAIS